MAQGAANVDAARVTGRLNRPDEYNPFGSRVWSDLGGDRFRVDTNFTPQGQALFNKDLGIKLGLANLGETAMGHVQNQLGKPADFSGAGRDQVADAYFRRLTRFMEPGFTQAQDKMRSDLVNRGFSVGTKGYDDAIAGLTQQQNTQMMDAADRAATTGAQQRISEILAERNLPMQELNALRTGAMPQTPTFQPYAGTGQVQPAPIMQGAMAQGQAGLDAYNASQAGKNAAMSGLFQLGAGALAGGYIG